ncbi:hypothetical protein J6590_008526 [Homalodisca vitripennis]|nr:hypothetical protein J6590_008526 [Homalodisca vitripennis]
MYETRDRANYRNGRHRTVVYERLPSPKCAQFLDKLPNSIKDAPTSKALKTRLKRFLVSQAFYAIDWPLYSKWVAFAMSGRGVVVKIVCINATGCDTRKKRPHTRNQLGAAGCCDVSDMRVCGERFQNKLRNESEHRIWRIIAGGPELDVEFIDHKKF